MATWDGVDFGFAGDETGNFGPRNESGSALYQVDTLAVISPNGTVEENPQVRSKSSGSNLCVAAGCHVNLFDEDGSNYTGTLAFESNVDALTWCPGADFLVIGEQNGSIHFINAETQTPLFSQTCVKNPRPNTTTFKDISCSMIGSGHLCEFLFLTSTTVYTLSMINLEEFRRGVKDKDMALLKELQKNMKVSVTDVRGEHSEGAMCAMHLGTYDNAIVTTGAGHSVLSIWTQRNDTLTPVRRFRHYNHGKGIRKIASLDKGRCLLTLDTDDKMHLWHAPTLTMLRQWAHYSILDFSILDVVVDNKNSSMAEEKIVVLMKSEEGEATCLSVRNLRTMEPEYTLSLAKFIHLVDSPPNQEFISFVEGVTDEEVRSPLISNLRLCSLSELQPETRFNRLLHKKQFEQAEILAKEFDLDVELVFKVKATGLLDQLSPWSVDKYSDLELDQLLKDLRNCLDLIQDENLIVQCCTKATPRSMETFRELLIYAKNRLSGCGKSGVNGQSAQNGVGSGKLGEPPVDREELMTRVLQALHRLDTFHMAYGPDAFTPSRWESFLAADMLEEVQQQFAAGAVLCASAVWRRHSNEFEEVLAEGGLLKMLEGIPESIPCQRLCPWLAQDFLPYVIRKLPGCLDMVAAWLEQRALNLEILEPADWPANGLNMAQLLENCMSRRESSIQSSLITPTELATPASCLTSTYKQESNETDEEEINAFAELHLLVLELTDLLSLHRKYRCPLTLEEYRKQTTESLTYRMLDRVPAVDLVPSEIVKVVRPYMKEHNLKEDKMLFQYVIDLGDRLGHSTMTCLEEMPWEEKAICVIGCISETEYKIKAVRSAVEKARVPWSKGMAALVEEALKLHHPLVTELEEQKRLVVFRMILLRYNMRHHNVLSERIGMKLIEYIIRQDEETSLKDALAVANHITSMSDTQVYSCRLDYYISKNRVSDAVKFVKDLPAEKAIHIGSSLFCKVRRELNTTVVFNTELCKERKLIMTHAVCAIVGYLLTLEELDSERREEFERQLYDLERIHCLQVEFSEFVTCNDYLCPTTCKKLLEKMAIAFLSKKGGDKLRRLSLKVDCGCINSRKPGKVKTWNYSQIYRLADLLKIPRHEFKGQLALHAAQAGQIKTAIKTARELHDDFPGPFSALVLYDVALKLAHIQAEERFLENCEEFSDIAAVIYEFAGIAVANCAQESLQDYLSFCQTCLMALNVARQCETGDYESCLKRSGISRDPYEEWTFDNYFEEDGLIMDSSVALPLAYKYILSSTSIIDTSADHGSGHSKGSGDGDEEDEEDEEDIFASINQLSDRTVSMVQHLKENNQMWLALRYSIDAFNVSSLKLLGPAFIEKKETETISTKRASLIKAITTRGLQTINSLKENIVQKIFRQRNCDHNLGLAFMLESPHEASKIQMTNMIQEASSHYKQISNIANVGVDVAMVREDLKMQNFFSDLEKKSHWAHKLNKIGVAVKEDTALNTVKGAMALLPSIVKQRAVDINFLMEYARTFSLDNNDVLLLYIQNQLLPKTDGRVDETPLKLKLQRVQSAISLIKLEDKLLKTLLEIFEKIDPYDYEILMFIFERVIHINPSDAMRQKHRLLEFLSVYQRVEPPSEYELTYRASADEHDHLTHEGVSISPLSKTRLPFHPLFGKNLWKILSPEFNASTIELWLPVARLLQLPIDNLYMLTIKNIVRQHVDIMKAHRSAQDTMSAGALVNKAQCNWEETDTISDTINSIKKLLLSVSSYQTAMTCTSWIVKELPMGSEKVLALRASVQIAKQWYESCPPESEEHQKAKTIYVKFEESHRRLSTEQVLFQENLGEQQLVSLSNKPTALIMELYKHSSIQKRSGALSKLSNLPDIHSTAEKIAAINNIVLNKVQLMLLEQWLPSTHAAPLDMSTTMDAENLELTFAGQDLDEDEINLKRLVYLLQHGQVQKSVMFLLNYSYRHESMQVTTVCRIRALRCLFQLAGQQLLQTVSRIPFNKFKEHLVTLMYVYELERLGMSQTIESFKKANKDGMVRSIWRNHRHEKRAVRLVANLCLDYEILDGQLWNIILQQLLAFNMVEYLRHVLFRLTEISELWGVPSLPNMWKSVLTQPLTSVSAPLSPTQEEECLQTLTLLHRCPCVLDQNLTKFAQLYQRLELPLCALSCVLLLPESSDRKTQSDRLLNDEGLATVLQQLEAYQSRGKQVPLLDQIEIVVLSYVKRHSLYDSLKGTCFAPRLALMLVQENSIEGLVLHLLEQDRIQELLQLLSLFQQMQPTLEYAQKAPHIPQGVEKIRLYAKLHNLTKKVSEFLPPEPTSEDEGEDDEEDSIDGNPEM